MEFNSNVSVHDRYHHEFPVKYTVIDPPSYVMHGDTYSELEFNMESVNKCLIETNYGGFRIPSGQTINEENIKELLQKLTTHNLYPKYYYHILLRQKKYLKRRKMLSK